ncbi:MAG: bifunctional 5,10-methylenetetrahydrofolate dehydrogenase/5,10-methenyltetrahydrofolate cyclohydrolase [Patescibacteria group bacterium]
MIVDGREIAEEILNRLAEEVKKLKPLTLAAVLAGNNPNSKKFIGLKRKAAEKIGIGFVIHEFPEKISTEELRKKIAESTKLSDGIIIELPLPPHINTQYVLDIIPIEKDVDVLSQKAQGAFFANQSKILPPSVEAAKTIFAEYDINPIGKNCAVFGHGLLVGKPISHWLTAQGANVSIITEHTLNPTPHILSADIIISGVGIPNLITADLVKAGAIVIDFGPDVDFEPVSAKTSLITPPTGGVGPIVIASVLKNSVGLGE